MSMVKEVAPLGTVTLPEINCQSQGTAPDVFTIVGAMSAPVPMPASVNICAAALVLCFFLPWAQLLGQTVSGYELAKLGSAGTWALFIPLTGAMVLLNYLLGSPNRGMAIAAGAVPLIGLLYGLSKTDGQIFKVFAFGAYLEIIAGICLILAAQNMFGRVERSSG